MADLHSLSDEQLIDESRRALAGITASTERTRATLHVHPEIARQLELLHEMTSRALRGLATEAESQREMGGRG